MDPQSLVQWIAESAKESEHLLNATLEYKGKGYGWEGLGRVIIVHALQKKGIEVLIRNKGPDLKFLDMEYELKFLVEPSIHWLEKGLKYAGIDCLFFGPSDFEFIGSRINLAHSSRINEKWIVGIIKNKKK